MPGEKKSSDLSSRLSVKRGAKLLSKTSKPISSTISTPPKAAIAASKAKKDEVPRRRNPFNDMLRQRSGEEADGARDTLTSTSEREPDSEARAPQASKEVTADRVAELERGLAVAKQEQGLLKEELEKFKQQWQARQDTIEESKQQLAETQRKAETAPSRVSTEHERGSQVRRSSDRPGDDVFRQNYELRYKLVHMQEELVAQDAMYRDQLERQTSQHGETEWNELRSRLHATEKESQERLQQLLSLKSSISSLTRVDSQITDSEIAESFSQLANRVREWVITNFRRSKLHLDSIPAETMETLKTMTPDHELAGRTDRLALLQSVVSTALMSIFQEPFIVGLPRTGALAAFRQCAHIIYGAGSEFREWRRVTIRAMEKSEIHHTINEGKKELLHRLARDVAHRLFTLTSVSLTSAAQAGLISMLNTAADLQHTLALQKAQYQVHYFSNTEGKSVEFDGQRMEPVNDLDTVMDGNGDTPTEQKFLFCVFPCLEKFGDEWGEHLDTSNVLLRARVCCGVG
ncbi:Nn.00g094140.m01.CDS01 [Neocucurbitaria sp. VM-36]